MEKVNYKEKAKKQNSTLLKARLKGDKFETSEEKEACLEVLKLRGVDVSAFEKKEDESITPVEVVVEGAEIPMPDPSNLNNVADDAYAAICEENNQEKVKLLAKLLEKEDGTSKDWEELTDEDKLKIIEISKIKAKKEKAPTPFPVRQRTEKAPKQIEEEVPFTEEQKQIVNLTELSKAERTRRLYDLGCSVKQISRNTGWDYVNAYDTIKAYNLKKEKLAALEEE